MTTMLEADIAQVRIVDLEKVRPSMNEDKYYHAYLLLDQPLRSTTAERYHVLLHWGRNGGRGQAKLFSFTTPSSAHSLWNDKVKEKIGGGYSVIGPDRVMQPVPAHILDRAGITPVFDKHHVQTPYDVLRAEISFAIIGATGDDGEFKRTLEMKGSLRETLDSLRAELTELEGQLEVVDILVMRRR
jgi:predicted DNA-binding WGR domain protein